MNYNSWLFWLLFLVVYIPYWNISHKNQNRLLLVVSYIFYGFWDYRFLFLILISTVIDFIGGLGVFGKRLPLAKLRGIALLIVAAAVLLTTNIRYQDLGSALLRFDWSRMVHALPTRVQDFTIVFATIVAVLIYGYSLERLYQLPEQKRKKVFLTISLVANLVILGFFKYYNFFLSGLESALSSVGVTLPPHFLLNVILPAGISFYTFQAMSYTVDIFREEIEPTESLSDFALFVCFFPHLIAGPIMRGHTLLPQVVQPRQKKEGALEEGFLLVLIGLFKKLVIADNMAPIANAVFFRFAEGTASTLSAGELWLGLYAFAFQIYGDFSGYSSIARGISKWLGFELVVNFRNPYLALSPSDFWQRWHISLSTWLRDYLYIPLGGNRGGVAQTYRNLCVTMVLGGLWHGASATFVAWGVFHGAILCLFRWLRIPDPKWGGGLPNRLLYCVRVLVMFHITCLGWLLFRADSLKSVGEMLVRMGNIGSLSPMVLYGSVMLGFLCGGVFLFEALMGSEDRYGKIRSWAPIARASLYSVLLLGTVIFAAQQSGEFIYFQF